MAIERGANSGRHKSQPVNHKCTPANSGYYSLVASNLYGTTTSSTAFLNVIDVPQALGATNLTWSNPSQPGWFAESTNTHDGFAAAAGGPVTYNQQSVLQTSVTGPGTVTFWWATSAWVALRFAVDGTLLGSWQQYFPTTWGSFTNYVASGVHVLTWTTVGQNYGMYGLGYLDQVTFSPGPTPVFITTQPASQTVAAGSNVTFSVETLGTPPFNYQWYFNGLGLPGGTGASLTLNNVQTNNVGSYSVVVSNCCGTAASSNALLAVTPSPPIITTQPATAYVMVGGQVSFTGAALGSSPLYYQWLLNGVAIVAATNTTLTLKNVQYADGGTYALLVTNWVGSALSSKAVLFPYTFADFGPALNAPGIVWSTTNVPWFPETNVTYDGVSAAQSGVIANTQQSTLQGTLTGPATVTYWWKVNCDSFWMNLAFALNGTVQNAIAGNVDWQPATNYLGAGSQVLQWNLYPVHAAFAGGTGWVDQVQVAFGGTAPTIGVNPGSVTINAGNTVTFSVAAIGTPPLQYQWQFNGSNIPGATNTSLALSNVQTNNTGLYCAVVSNGFGSATSSNATLTVNPVAPVITAQPASQSAAINGNAVFYVGATGSTPFSYQWQLNGAPLPGGTGTTLSLSNVQMTNAGNYNVIVANPFGVVTSSVAVLQVSRMVVIDYWRSSTSGFSGPTGLSNITAIAAGVGHTVALRADGLVLSWGYSNYGLTNVPPGLSNVVAIAAGDNHTVALKSDGTVTAWGDNTYGQLLVPAGLSNVASITAAANDTFALKNDGTVVGWGNNLNSQLSIPAGLSNVQAIAAGVFNGFALAADGSMVQWGNGPVWQSSGTNAQLVVAPGWSNLLAVAAGGYSAWTLDASDNVLPWGWAHDLDFGVVAIAAAGSSANPNPASDYLVGLNYNGTVFIGIGSPSYVPYIPASPNNVIAIAVAPQHATALVNDGTPRVVARSLNQTVYTSATVGFSPGIIGAAPLSFQWQFNGTNIDWATNGFLVLTNVPLSAAGSYNCIAGNGLGTVTNQSAWLTVLRSTLQFSAAPSLSTNGLTLQLNHLSGHGPTIIYASSNLVQWQPIFTNPPVTGSLQFIDSSAITAPMRFYRGIEQ